MPLKTDFFEDGFFEMRVHSVWQRTLAPLDMEGNTHPCG
jgi:hypothetical protein